jgi:hypothetical protein
MIARGRDEWNRFALLLATIINSNPFRSGAPADADEINPYSEPRDQSKSLVMLTGSEMAIRYNGNRN